MMILPVVGRQWTGQGAFPHSARPLRLRGNGRQIRTVATTAFGPVSPAAANDKVLDWLETHSPGPAHDRSQTA
jgi:hypothetical protein